MMIKLKCVDNVGNSGIVSGYLTPGKVYTARQLTCKQVPTGIYEIVDDDGDAIHTLSSDSTHAKWEVVN